MMFSSFNSVRPAVLAIGLLFSAVAGHAAPPAIIPQPQQLQLLDGAFRLAPDSRILADSPARATARYLRQRLQPATGYPLPLKSQRPARPADIDLIIDGANTNLAAEGYALAVATNGVTIRAATAAGLFYGAQTFLQLLPPEIFLTNRVSGIDWQVPAVRIDDWPEFRWRGLMLDVSRHFYTPAEVERLLDLMALYKLNVFHWHLTDSEGWRLQIPQYPQLTRAAAWRPNSELVHPKLREGETNAHPAWTAPAADKFRADGMYGGCYTGKDIREVVAYASARHILIVPEIEMPGHSRAALAAYPGLHRLGEGGDTNTPIAGMAVYDPANPETFEFLDNVLSTVFRLFPGPYVHIGGDEVRKDYWAHSQDCQDLMAKEGLKDEKELQSWFIKRIENYVNAHGKVLLGWSEILQGGLATNAVVMDWIGGGREAAAAGHDVVMTPTSRCYFNYYQSTNHATEPRAQGDFLPLRKVYAFNPAPAGLDAQGRSHILGAQGNLWAEYVASLAHAEYMYFPRACALAEVLWSPKSSRDFGNFQVRLAESERRLDALQVNYRREPISIR